MHLPGSCSDFFPGWGKVTLWGGSSVHVKPLSMLVATTTMEPQRPSDWWKKLTKICWQTVTKKKGWEMIQKDKILKTIGDWSIFILYWQGPHFELNQYDLKAFRKVGKKTNKTIKMGCVETWKKSEARRHLSSGPTCNYSAHQDLPPIFVSTFFNAICIKGEQFSVRMWQTSQLKIEQNKHTFHYYY